MEEEKPKKRFAFQEDEILPSKRVAIKRERARKYKSIIKAEIQEREHKKAKEKVTKTVKLNRARADRKWRKGISVGAKYARKNISEKEASKVRIPVSKIVNLVVSMPFFFDFSKTIEMSLDELKILIITNSSQYFIVTKDGRRFGYSTFRMEGIGRKLVHLGYVEIIKKGRIKILVITKEGEDRVLKLIKDFNSIHRVVLENLGNKKKIDQRLKEKFSNKSIKNEYDEAIAFDNELEAMEYKNMTIDDLFKPAKR